MSRMLIYLYDYSHTNIITNTVKTSFSFLIPFKKFIRIEKFIRI